MQATNPSAGEVLATPAPGVAARHVATAPTVGSTAWKTFAQLPDLINGDATTFTYIFVGAGLAAAWHVPIDAVFGNMAPITDEASMTARILAEATVYQITLVGVYPDAAKVTSAAVMLAAARVSSRRSWGLKDADAVGSQMFNTAAVLEADGTLGADTANFATVAEWNTARATVAREWTAQQDDFAPKAIQMGVDMPVCNGATIVVTNVHHYVDPHKAICDVCYLQHVSEGAALPGGLSELEAKDILCHKTAHVWKSPVLVYLSRNKHVKIKLNSIGHGSAAVRVPAEFPPEKAASAICGLINKAALSCTRANVAIDVEPARIMKAEVIALVDAEPNATGMANATAKVDEFKEANGAHVAWCGGYMASMFEGTGAPKRSKSVLESWAVKGLIADNFEAYQEGYEHYGLYTKWQKAMAKEGHLAGHGLFGHATPAAFMNPVDEMEAKLKAQYSSGGDMGG